MDLFKKYFDNTSIYDFVSDYVTNYLHFVNEKPMSSILVPVTLSLLCYYIYIYVRKFYPIRVNCWFCNANFKVAFEDRFEYTCIECGQFNGFKKDGSYSKIIPEQHDHRYNRTIFTVNQNEKIKDSKNGLCHKCNIIQEMKVKQLASFVPIEERNFDKEVEKFKENLEATLNLCSKCYQYTRKVLSLQEKHYNLNSVRMDNRTDEQNVSSWYNISSLCLSLIVVLLSSGVENYFGDWTAKFDEYTFIPHNSFVTIARSISIASLTGTICQVYQCLSTLDKLSAVIMLLWSLLFVVENTDILEQLKPKLLISVLIALLSSASIIRNLTRKQKVHQTNIKLDSEKHQFNTTNYCDISTNGSSKNSDESEMMDIDRIEKTPKKKTLYKNVNNLFRGMRLNDNHSVRSNIIRPPKFIMPIKRRYKRIPGGYAESSPGEYYTSPFSIKDDYEFDTQSIFSQDNYNTQCLSLYRHQSAAMPYAYYPSPPLYQRPNQLNSSHSSNTSNVQQQQQTVEWTKMLIYSIPGIVLFGLQCYLLNDIKDFMKQK